MSQELEHNFGFSSDANQNSLMHYLQSLAPEAVAQLSRPQSSEVTQVMEHNITSILGNLPSGHFNVNITTSKENLGRLLASAMVSGYFLKSAELRYSFEQSLESTTDASSSSTDEVG